MVIALLVVSPSSNVLAQVNTGFNSECVTEDPLYKTVMTDIGFYSDTSLINYNTWEKLDDAIRFSFLMTTNCDDKFQGSWSIIGSNVYLNYEKINDRNPDDSVEIISDCACQTLMQWQTSIAEMDDLNIYVNQKRTRFIPFDQFKTAVERKADETLINEACNLKSRHGEMINVVGRLTACEEHLMFQTFYDDECSDDYLMELEYSQQTFENHFRAIMDSLTCESYVLFELQGKLVKDENSYGHLGLNNSKLIVEKVYRNSPVLEIQD